MISKDPQLVLERTKTKGVRGKDYSLTNAGWALAARVYKSAVRRVPPTARARIIVLNIRGRTSPYLCIRIRVCDCAHVCVSLRSALSFSTLPRMPPLTLTCTRSLTIHRRLNPAGHCAALPPPPPPHRYREVQPLPGLTEAAVHSDITTYCSLEGLPLLLEAYPAGTPKSNRGGWAGGL